jgi:hypothetical protein
MRLTFLLTLGVLIGVSTFSSADDKKKPILPATILNARTVAVIIDPQAGVSTDAPLANKAAVEDVEKAFSNWGRFKPTFQGMAPDMVIVIRKGNGKIVQPTINGGPSPNDRPVVLQPNDNGIRIGGQKGRLPDQTQNDPQANGTGPGVGVGASEDSFIVYDGAVADPLSSAPIWRYVAKNALHSHDVPAVAEFKKIVEETEKQLQKQQQKKP